MGKKKVRILSDNEKKLLNSASRGSFNENYAEHARVDVIKEAYLSAARYIQNSIKHNNDVALDELKDSLHQVYRSETLTPEEVKQNLKASNREPLMLGKGYTIRQEYARAIKYARKARDEKLAGEIQSEYNSLKRKSEKMIVNTSNKKSLLSRIFGSVLILFSALFILFSANGLTGKVIFNEGISSSLSVALAVLVLIIGIYLWVKK